MGKELTNSADAFKPEKLYLTDVSSDAVAVFDIDFQIENFKIIVDFLKEKKYKLKQKINH